MGTRAASQVDRAFDVLPFERQWAATVARWVRSDEELRLLAPSSVPPLDADEVARWVKPGGTAYLAWVLDEQDPIGYGEVNPMRNRPHHFWLGHVILRPSLRGRGLGRRFSERLVTEAFDHHGAKVVALIVFPENMAAVECYLSVGFRSAGEEYHTFHPGGPKERFVRLEITPSRARHPLTGRLQRT